MTVTVPTLLLVIPLFLLVFVGVYVLAAKPWAWVADRMIVRAVRRYEQQTGYEWRRCADGSLVHNFKGASRCPACGFRGVLANDTRVT